MAKKSNVLAVDFKHLGLSTLITVSLAEIIPALFFLALFKWQGYSLGTYVAVGNFFQKETYTLADLTSYGTYAMGFGVLLTVGVLVALSILLTDEWFFAHRLDSLKNVTLYGLAWATAYFIVDSLLTGGGIAFPTLAAISSSTSLMVALIIFVVPFLIYFARKFAAGRK